MATDTAPLVSRINVVYLYVRDMQRSVAFYRDLLRIPLEGDDDSQEAEIGARFALHRWREGMAEPSAGTIHVNLEVADADAAAARVRAAGYEVRETMRDDWGTGVEVADPDGYRLYLFQPPG